MNLLLFIMLLSVSFIVVRVGAIAFQLTGLEWSIAKFQALSCFTSTGFTTRESELVTGDPRRRRIASVLIVLGNAGLVTMVATFANTLRPRLATQSISIPYLPFDIPGGILPWLNLVVAVAATYIVYKIFTNSRLARKLTDSLRRRLMARADTKSISFEELLVATGGYGVSNIRIPAGHSVIGSSLAGSRLRQHDIMVLAISRGSSTIPNPPADTVISEGDELICFGELVGIRSYFSVGPKA